MLLCLDSCLYAALAIAVVVAVVVVDDAVLALVMVVVVVVLVTSSWLELVVTSVTRVMFLNRLLLFYDYPFSHRCS